MFSNPNEFYWYLGLAFFVCLAVVLIVAVFIWWFVFKYDSDDVQALYESYPLVRSMILRGKVQWREWEFYDNLKSFTSEVSSRGTSNYFGFLDVIYLDRSWFVATSKDELVAVPQGEKLANYLVGDWKYIVLSSYGLDSHREEETGITIYLPEDKSE